MNKILSFNSEIQNLVFRALDHNQELFSSVTESSVECIIWPK